MFKLYAHTPAAAEMPGRTSRRKAVIYGWQKPSQTSGIRTAIGFEIKYALLL
jgi:hypothetical protein